MVEFKFFGWHIKQIRTLWPQPASQTSPPSSHPPHTPHILHSSHTENMDSIPHTLCTITFPAFVVSASRKPSLTSFNGISCIHSISEIPLQWNLSYLGYFFTFPPLTCGFSEFRDHIWYIFAPPVSLPESSGLYICWINEWMNNATQKGLWELLFPFHVNFTSWEARKYFRHPLLSELTFFSTSSVKKAKYGWSVLMKTSFSSRTNRRNTSLYLWGETGFLLRNVQFINKESNFWNLLQIISRSEIIILLCISHLVWSYVLFW